MLLAISRRSQRDFSLPLGFNASRELPQSLTSALARMLKEEPHTLLSGVIKALWPRAKLVVRPGFEPGLNAYQAPTLTVVLSDHNWYFL